MKKREDYYKNIDDEANKKLSDAEELKSSYEDKLKASDEEIAEKQKAAYDSFSKEIDEQRAEAEKEAESIIESARIDGANSLQQFIHISHKNEK